MKIDPLSIKGKIEIGKGGFGIVYKAKWNNKEVAIKEINSNPKSEELIKNELDKLIQLNHSNIVTLFGTIDNPCSIVMEFIEGGKINSK